MVNIKRIELGNARYHLEACKEWTDTAQYLSMNEYSAAQDLEWAAMKEEACLEQKVASHRLTIRTRAMRRM